MEAVVARVGAQRVGIRLSPYGTFLQACVADAPPLHHSLPGNPKHCTNPCCPAHGVPRPHMHAGCSVDCLMGLQDALEDDAAELTLYLVKELAKLQPLYLHCIEARAAGHEDLDAPPEQTLLPFRKAWPVSLLGAE